MEKSSKRFIYYIPAALLIVAAFIIGWQYKRVSAMKISIENNYSRAFHELTDYVNDIDANLQKSMLVSSAAQSSALSNELFRESVAAKACLAQLPISEISLENTEKFLSQIGDFTYLLSQKLINSEEISDEDYSNLQSLAKYSEILKNELLSVREDIYSGNISLGEIEKSVSGKLSVAEAAGGDILANFENVEKRFQEYPSLIYDGPFSEHIEKINPVMTENARTVTSDEALKAAREFLGEWGDILRFDGESHDTPLASYLFKASNDHASLYAAFVKKGGYPLYFLINREIGEEKFGISDAISSAEKYLAEKGFLSMQKSYYDTSGGIATINFAYKQGNVTCYSDLIKIKVALDNGEIIGFEAKGYLTNHKQRDLGGLQLTEEEALKKINPRLSVDSISTALIPKNNKTEVLCYEIKGTHSGKNFLIYINAENGHEEKILLLLEDENGILTI